MTEQEVLDEIKSLLKGEKPIFTLFDSDTMEMLHIYATGIVKGDARGYTGVINSARPYLMRAELAIKSLLSH